MLLVGLGYRKLKYKVDKRTPLQAAPFQAAPMEGRTPGGGAAPQGFVPLSSMSTTGRDIAVDPETGDSYDVSDPRNPKKIDPKTGKTAGGSSGGEGPWTDEHPAHAKPTPKEKTPASGGSSGGGSSSRSSSSKTSGETKSPPSSIGRDPETGEYVDFSDPTSPKVVDPKTGIPVDAPKPDTSTSSAPTGTKSPPSSIGRDPETGDYIDYSDPTSPRTVDKSGIWVGWSKGGGSSSSTPKTAADKYKDMFAPGSELYKAFAKLSSKEQDHIAGLRGREQFNAMVKARLIPEGSYFVQDDPNKGWRYQTPEQTEFFRTHRKLPDGKWISDKDYEALDPKYKKIADEKGFDAMQKAFDCDHVKLPDGSYMPNEDYKKMPIEWQKIASTAGQKGLERLEKERERAEKILEPYKDKDGNYDVVKYLKDVKGTKGGEQVLKNAGFNEDTIKNATYLAKISKIQAAWQGMTPWDESKGETVAGSGKDSKWLDIRTGKTISEEEYKKIAMSSEADYYVRSTDSDKQLVKNVSVMAAEIVVPGVYAARHWNDMTDGEKAFNIVLDVASVIPFVGAASRGARLVSTAGKAARLASAAKAVGREAAGQVMAPVNLIIHPVSSAKTTVRSVANLVENIADIRKLPEVVVYTSYGTTRLRLSDLKNPADAKAVRDALMELAAKGERPIVQIGDQVIELARSPLMKELKGGLVHTTPMGEAFEGGLKVAKKPGMPPSEQGLFLSHEPLPRFTKTTAFNLAGGDKPIIYITSREMAEKSIPTAKLYDSPVGKVAEMERKFAVSTDVQPPVQKLYTRIGPEGQVVEIWLEKPLSKLQIAKLKLMGITETFKSIWTEPIKIKNRGVTAGLTKSDIEDVANILKESGNADQARNLLRAEGLATAMRKPVPALSRVTKNVSSAQVEAARKRLGITKEDLARSRPEMRISSRGIEGVATTRIVREAMPDWETATTRAGRNDGVRAGASRRSARDGTEGASAKDRTPARDDRTPESDRVGRTDDRTPPDDRVPPEDHDRKKGDDPGRDKADPHDKLTDLKGKVKDSLAVTPEQVKSAVAVQQGAFVHVFFHPYGQKDVRVYRKGFEPHGVKLVPAGKGSAYRSVQTFVGKEGPSKLGVDMGTMDMIIRKPSSPGKPGTIDYIPDPHQRTKLDVTIKGVRASGGRPSARAIKEGRMFRLKGQGLTRNASRRGRLA